MTIYRVVHSYETDGGYGDAVRIEEPVATFLTREEADEVVKKYSKPHIYMKPYDELCCGLLEIEEEEVGKIPDEKDMWWLHNEDLGPVEV